MDKLTKFLQKLVNKETVTYIFFGVCTTVVNLIAFKLLDMIFGDELYLVTNAVAWILAVAFAFITNKLFVFESKSFGASVLKKEIPTFLGARILSFFIEEGGLYLFVDILGFDKYGVSLVWLNQGENAGDLVVGGKMLSKLISAVVVVILNYFFSKLIVFRKKAE